MTRRSATRCKPAENEADHVSGPFELSGKGPHADSPMMECRTAKATFNIRRCCPSSARHGHRRRKIADTFRFFDVSVLLPLDHMRVLFRDERTCRSSPLAFRRPKSGQHLGCRRAPDDRRPPQMDFTIAPEAIANALTKTPHISSVAVLFVLALVGTGYLRSWLAAY